MWQFRASYNPFTYFGGRKITKTMIYFVFTSIELQPTLNSFVRATASSKCIYKLYMIVSSSCQIFADCPTEVSPIRIHVLIHCSAPKSDRLAHNPYRIGILLCGSTLVAHQALPLNSFGFGPLVQSKCILSPLKWNA